MIQFYHILAHINMAPWRTSAKQRATRARTMALLRPQMGAAQAHSGPSLLSMPSRPFRSEWTNHRPCRCVHALPRRPRDHAAMGGPTLPAYVALPSTHGSALICKARSADGRAITPGGRSDPLVASGERLGAETGPPSRLPNLHPGGPMALSFCRKSPGRHRSCRGTSAPSRVRWHIAARVHMHRVEHLPPALPRVGTLPCARQGTGGKQLWYMRVLCMVGDSITWTVRLSTGTRDRLRSMATERGWTIDRLLASVVLPEATGVTPPGPPDDTFVFQLCTRLDALEGWQRQAQPRIDRMTEALERAQAKRSPGGR